MPEGVGDIGIHYTQVIGLLVEAVKDLKAQDEALQGS